MTNPLNKYIRFGLYVAAIVVGWVQSWLLTGDPVTVLSTVQTSLLTLAASRVRLGADEDER